MAYPTWLTPAGDLGIVPEGEYYQYALDAYDTTGGTLTYSKLSGTLPPGLQIVQATGMLQGIPISTGGADLNQTYTFAVRVKNTSSGRIADRSFTLTVTNVFPPVIIPRDVDLGEYFDGDVLDLQLNAVDLSFGATITWSVKNGELPPGITLSSNGLLSGYIQLIPAVGPTGDPGWDENNWDSTYVYSNVAGYLGWDFPLGTTSKHFNFTIEASDGILTDTSTYTMYVIPKQNVLADSSLITADISIINGVKFTVDTGNKHNPIITTTQTDIEPYRQGSWFNYQIQAIDLDGDTLRYQIPNQSQGSFDEQSIIGQYPYAGGGFVSNSNITVGTTQLGSNVQAYVPGTDIQVLAPYTDAGGTTYLWYNATVNNHVKIQLTGNAIIRANIGDYISQAASGANATVANISATTGNLYIGGGPLTGTIAINGNLVTANVGDFLTQVGSTGNATITSAQSLSALISVLFTSGTFNLTGNLKINGANIGTYPVEISQTVNATQVDPNIGDVITQAVSGANATVIGVNNSYGANTAQPNLLKVRFNSNTFVLGSGNIQVNGSDVAAYPVSASYTADVNAIYTTSSTFKINQSGANAYAYVAGVNTNAIPTDILSLGVDVGALSTQGTAGFDEDKFDQGALSLPGTLAIDQYSGWITGFLPSQTINEATYNFEIQVSKKDYSNYYSTRLFTITVLGNLYNSVDWLTPADLGSLENGTVSDLSVLALSSQNKQVYYYYTPGSYINMPQGLKLQPDGLISGRASFELFGLDGGATTFDSDIITGDPTTTFDHTFTFSVTASTVDQSASSIRVFSLLIRERNLRPYNDLYLKAMLDSSQRLEFRDLLRDNSVFPPESIYRTSDPWFGLAKDIRMLYLPGLNPETLSDYAAAMDTNHFTKRLLFSEVKTAVARQDGSYDVNDVTTGAKVGTYNAYSKIFVPNDFSLGYTVASTIPSGTVIGDQTIKYEVVYLEVVDQNSNSAGQGPADSIDLRSKIDVPYYDTNGNVYYVATPNAFTNMDDAIVNGIGYQNIGALPEWMSSIQKNGTQLGFVHAVVLAYAVPGAGDSIAWRFKQQDYDLNEFNFVVDRYYLDNTLSTNFDIAANTFITSRETTFDRYPAISSTLKTVGTVDYAVNTSFESIDHRNVSDINDAGGLDGITGFKDGQTLVFFNQEFHSGISITDSYNQGWSNSTDPWDDPGTWDYDYAWDPANYIPGYQEWLSSKISGNVDLYSVPNQRISVWRINIDTDNNVELTLANVYATMTGITSNTTGFGSNIRVSSTDGLFVGMPVKGRGLANTAVVTDIFASNIVVYPTVDDPISTAGNVAAFIPQPNFNDALYVRNGLTHGGINIYYDPYVKTGNLIPNYSKITQQIKTTGTTFDGDGTKFYDYRDVYSTPQDGGVMLKFPHQTVFN